jgi:hypothetical protein
MSCDNLNALYERAGHACEICGEPERPYVLNIDHEPFLGRYAVRGLLCGGCNGWLGTGSKPIHNSHPDAKRYLDNPWWARPGGPRPLDKAPFAQGEHDDLTHVIGGLGVRKIGRKHPHQTRCGQQLYRAIGIQLYQVQDSKVCIFCADRDPIEMERLEYYRRHPSAFAL